MVTRSSAILDYWFHGPRNGAPDLAALNRFWFARNDAVDAYIRRCFDAAFVVGETVALDAANGARHVALTGVIEVADATDLATVVTLRRTAVAPGTTPARHDPPALVRELDDERATVVLESDLRRAAREPWTPALTPAHGALAVVIVLDQLARNMFRGTPRAFRSDPLALAVSRQAIAGSLDEELSLIERAFLYMPMEHSEDLVAQTHGVTLFAELLARAPVDDRAVFAEFHHYAVVHRRIIERFGRFPHRNAILGRASTPEELRFLAEPDSAF